MQRDNDITLTFHKCSSHDKWSGIINRNVNRWSLTGVEFWTWPLDKFGQEGKCTGVVRDVNSHVCTGNFWWPSSRSNRGSSVTAWTVSAVLRTVARVQLLPDHIFISRDAEAEGMNPSPSRPLRQTVHLLTKINPWCKWPGDAESSAQLLPYRRTFFEWQAKASLTHLRNPHGLPEADGCTNTSTATSR